MNEHYWLIQAMKQYGGSFIRALGEAYRLADTSNRETLRKAFPDYFKLYTAHAEKLKREDDAKP
jgi:hypothetical protein